MRQVARRLQIAALLLLPLGMIFQIANIISVAQMLVMLVAGFSLFYIARIVEGYTRSDR